MPREGACAERGSLCREREPVPREEGERARERVQEREREGRGGGGVVREGCPCSERARERVGEREGGGWGDGIDSDDDGGDSGYVTREGDGGDGHSGALQFYSFLVAIL